jgi:hypothetical protein
MNVKKELKLIFKTKNQAQAINELFKRLEKRTWTLNGKSFHLSGYTKEDLILFTGYEKEGEGVLIDHKRFCPLNALDCLSGKLETI